MDLDELKQKLDNTLEWAETGTRHYVASQEEVKEWASEIEEELEHLLNYINKREA